MEDVLDPAQKNYIMRVLNDLTGSKGRAGVITQETIATVLGVTVSTVARWSRGETIPDDIQAIHRLAFLHKQVSCWYLRVCPFVLMVWVPGDAAGDDPDRDRRHHGEFVKSVAFTRVGERVVRAVVTLDATFRSLSFCVIGPHRNEVTLSRDASDAGGRTVSFDARLERPRSASRVYSRGHELDVFLHYSV